MNTSREIRERASRAQLPRVVIIGGGFGGLYAARELAWSPVAVTLIDKRNYHLFRPMLYQVATGLISSDEIAAPIRSILRRQKNVTVLMAEVVGVDPHSRVVLTRDGTVAYDYLVLATGIEYNYFGHEEWKAHAPGLASVDDADRIRGKILTAFETAEQLAANGKADPATLRELLTFVQVGGGTAGVEMAATMAEMARMALAEDFRHIDPRSARILLFEAAPRVLRSYPEKLSEKAHRYLEGLGIEVHTNTRVERVDEHGVVVNGERIAIYELTGPRSQDLNEIAREYSDALNREVTYADISPDDWVRQLKQAGLPEYLTKHLVTMAELNRAGRYDRFADGVERVTGQAPTSVREFVSLHADKFGGLRTANTII